MIKHSSKYKYGLLLLTPLFFSFSNSKQAYSIDNHLDKQKGIKAVENKQQQTSFKKSYDGAFFRSDDALNDF